MVISHALFALCMLICTSCLNDNNSCLSCSQVSNACVFELFLGRKTRNCLYIYSYGNNWWLSIRWIYNNDSWFFALLTYDNMVILTSHCLEGIICAYLNICLESVYFYLLAIWFVHTCTLSKGTSCNYPYIYSYGDNLCLVSILFWLQ